jgi:hypothetical protein
MGTAVYVAANDAQRVAPGRGTAIAQYTERPIPQRRSPFHEHLEGGTDEMEGLARARACETVRRNAGPVLAELAAV